jgi:hypothetical protein
MFPPVAVIFDVLVPEQSVDCADIVTGFQQVLDERVPQLLAGHAFADPRHSGRVFHGAVNGTGVSVPPNLPARLVVLSNERGAKQRLPPELGAGSGDCL